MIQPTVGRKVWYYQSISDAMDSSVQPRDATVVYVVSDRIVNLRVSDTQGDTTPKLAVQLYQEGDEDPKGEFACWMPYQAQQAKRESQPTNFGERISALETQTKLLQESLNELQASLRAKPQPDMTNVSNNPMTPGTSAPSAPSAGVGTTKQITK